MQALTDLDADKFAASRQGFSPGLVRRPKGTLLIVCDPPLQLLINLILMVSAHRGLDPCSDAPRHEVYGCCAGHGKHFRFAEPARHFCPSSLAY